MTWPSSLIYRLTEKFYGLKLSAWKSLTLGCFYRPPDSKISTSEELVKSLDLMPNQTIVLGGDFNPPGMDWDNGVVNPKAANKSQCELLLSSLDTHALAQIHKEPTREENILDLLITNKPGLIKSSQCVSAKMLIGKLSGNKLGAAGPPFQKIVPAVTFC